MKIESTNTQSLHKQLKSFGLNPANWLLFEDLNGEYLIQNKTDRSFILKGKVAKNIAMPTWKDVKVVCC
jgi:hypothetical protein